MVLGIFVRDPGTGEALANAIGFPMMFLAGSFFPIDSMPSFLQTIARALPLTYINEGLRATMVLANDGTAVTYLLVNGAVNAVGHAFGRRPHPNTSTNNQWLAWLTFGEGLHNNHHAAPTSAKLALNPGEVDPAWPIVRFLVGRGWAKLRHHETRPAHTVAA